LGGRIQSVERSSRSRQFQGLVRRQLGREPGRNGDKSAFDDFNGRRETGIFFACEEERAAFYGPVRSYCLQVKNPLDLRDPYAAWAAGGEAKEIIESIFADHHEGTHDDESGEPVELYDVITAIEHGNLWRMDGTGGFRMHSWRALQGMAERSGFDALIVPDAGEGVGTGIDWVVFSSDQVKCVSEHSGLFLTGSGSVTDAAAARELQKAHDCLEVIGHKAPARGVAP